MAQQLAYVAPTHPVCVEAVGVQGRQLPHKRQRQAYVSTSGNLSPRHSVSHRLRARGRPSSKVGAQSARNGRRSYVLALIKFDRRPRKARMFWNDGSRYHAVATLRSVR